MSLLPLALSFVLFVSPAFAAQWEVSSADEFRQALVKAEEGDTIRLSEGVYEGSFEINRPLTVEGSEGTVIDAQGKGSCLFVKANNVVIRSLELKNYGSDLYQLDSGVRINDRVHGVELTKLKMQGPGFGIRADHASDITIKNSEIRGKKRMHVLDRGDGVYFNYVRGAVLDGNKVLFTRDGFYFENTDEISSDNNYFGGVQYGIHYMYARSASASGNKAVGSIGGYAIMSSERIELKNNTSDRTVEFGVLLNESEHSVVAGNIVSRVHNPRGKPALDTEGKGIFIYGGGINSVTNNSFERSDIGVSMAMGGEGTALSRNRFVDNKTQVRYVGSQTVDWSKEGVGNYWSSYQGWDLNNDGIGDRAYQPNDALDRLFWHYPNARFLMDSPVVSLLRFLAKTLDLDKGCGVVDRFPLFKDPAAAKQKTS